MQRFLSQPFQPAETFTGIAGVFVSREDTIDGFKRLVEGELDAIPEAAFFMAGTLESVYQKAKELDAA